MRACVIVNFRVVNVIEVNDLSFMPNLVDGTQGGNIGDIWDGTQFISPPPVPADNQ